MRDIEKFSFYSIAVILLFLIACYLDDESLSESPSHPAFISFLSR